MSKEISPEQIAAKEKAEAIIQSCANCEHFSHAVPFMDLFLRQFQDQEAYADLIDKFKKRKLEVNCHEV